MPATQAALCSAQIQLSQPLHAISQRNKLRLNVATDVRSWTLQQSDNLSCLKLQASRASVWVSLVISGILRWNRRLSHGVPFSKSCLLALRCFAVYGHSLDNGAAGRWRPERRARRNVWVAKGYSPHDAEDLTQAFFARILEKGYLKVVDRNKGKFRSFLLGALDHFIANEWRRANAQKRGGKLCFLSLDEQTAEERYLQVAASDLSPEKVLEQRWAMALLEQVLSRLRAEFVAAAKGHLFEQLKIFLTGEKKPAAYSELAATLQTSEAALKMSRIRRAVTNQVRYNQGRRPRVCRCRR